MNFLKAISNVKKSAIILLLSTLFLLTGNRTQTFAHGGEDHGDSQPKSTASAKGTISHTARLGEYELLLKHLLLEPDTATVAHLFITKFQTNEPIDKASATIEFESANGSVTEVIIEKTETAGSYNVKIPALPQGIYIVRAKLTYNGETDTATFSGVEVKSQLAVPAESDLSWTQTALIAFVSALVLGLYGGLVYFVWRFAGDEPMKEETVSA